MGRPGRSDRRAGPATDHVGHACETAGSDATQASYYQPLLDQIAAAGPLTGRVEVPELIGHWEAYYVARPDSDRAGLAAADRHRAQSRRLLRPTTQCAVLPGLSAADGDAVRRHRRCARHLLCAPGDPADRRRTPLPAEVWRSAHWRLYAVDGATSIVSSPGVLVAQDAAHITLDGSAGISGATQATVVAVVDARRRTRRVYRAVGSGSCVARRKPRQFDVPLRDFVQFDERVGARSLLRRSDLRQEVSLICPAGAFGSAIIAFSSWWVAARPSTVRARPPGRDRPLSASAARYRGCATTSGSPSWW